MKSLGLAVGSGAIGEPFKKVAAVWVESTMRETTREARQCMEKAWEAWVGMAGSASECMGRMARAVGGWQRVGGWWQRVGCQTVEGSSVQVQRAGAHPSASSSTIHTPATPEADEEPWEPSSAAAASALASARQKNASKVRITCGWSSLDMRSASCEVWNECAAISRLRGSGGCLAAGAAWQRELQRLVEF